MIKCGKKKYRNKSDISNVAKMAEATDDVNNSNTRVNNVDLFWCFRYCAHVIFPV